VSGALQMMSDAERAVDVLLEDAHLAGPYHIAGLVARHAATLRAGTTRWCTWSIPNSEF
jgi:hypothetical protein